MNVLISSDAHQPNPVYRGALLSAGARSEEIRLIFPGEPLPVRFDGLLLAGGSDVSPARYGESAVSAEVEVRPERDALDFDLLARALALGVPVFGICRGLQVLNVAFGGTLYQDLPSQRDRGICHAYDREDGHPPGLLAHDLRLIGGSDAPLSGILARATSLRVNSRHHQGVKRLAPGLVAVAEAPDGLIEAVVRPGGPYLAAVQWHPEDLVAEAAQRTLLEEFLAAAAAR